MHGEGISRTSMRVCGLYSQTACTGCGLYLQTARIKIDLLNRSLAARRKARESWRFILKTRNDLQQVRDRQHGLHSSGWVQQLDLAFLPLQRDVACNDDADASATDL